MTDSLNNLCRCLPKRFSYNLSTFISASFVYESIVAIISFPIFTFIYCYILFYWTAFIGAIHFYLKGSQCFCLIVANCQIKTATVMF